jgi:hypothetical protein
MHQDVDWVIRIASYKGVGFAMLPQPLSIWRVGDRRTTVGRNPDWKFSLSWIRQRRTLISPRAFSWFIAIQCVWRARTSHAGMRARLALLWAFFSEGRPELLSFLSFLAFALIPARIRTSLRAGIWKSSGNTSSGLHLVFARKPGAPILRKSSF